MILMLHLDLPSKEIRTLQKGSWEKGSLSSVLAIRRKRPWANEGEMQIGSVVTLEKTFPVSLFPL